MKQVFEPMRGFFAKRRKLGAIAIALIVIELAAAGTVAIAGREWLEGISARAQPAGGRAPATGFSGSLSAPSLAVF
jgi:hypothetical protein